ncbi:26S proteasome non-ATPase regulatory subunit 7 homolog A [Tanacetum coccineum]
MDVIKSQQLSVRAIEKVVVHPLVLLSIVDNYYRVAKDTRKRVVGVLLGTSFKGTVDVTNSYAVPFEEDDKDPSIWFLDHNYHEAMFSMFKRINAKEHVVGWYSTGPKLRENDLDVHGLFTDYVPNPVLVIIDVQPKELGIPTKAYYAIEEVKENATQKSQKVFVHVSSEIAAHEVEEIGVEHLLRDVKDTTISTLATEVTGKLAALKGLDARLKEIRGYLDLVIDGKLPLNHEILYHLQDVFNLLPNLNVADLIKAFAVKTNDQMLVIYLSSLIRSVIALHNLINNKMLNKEHEKAEDAKPATVPPAKKSSSRLQFQMLNLIRWNECYDNEDELQSFRHKARQQDKVYEEREESCWILHLRTGIFYPKGHEGVMNEVPDGAAIFASSYWLRNSDMYRV